MSASPESPAAQAACAALLGARRTGRALPVFPAPAPATLAAAYAAQQRLSTGLGGAVLGWKVGRIPPAMVDELGTDRVTGPVLRIAELDSATPGDARIFVGGVGAIETEVMLRLRAVPAARLADNDEAPQWVDAVRAGFEIASSPAPDIYNHAPFGIIADIGINNGLLLGPPLDLADFDRIAVTTELDGVAVGTGRALDILDGPWGALRFLVDLHHDGTIRLAPGQWISAGAITGVHPVAVGQRATARFGSAATIACNVVAEPGFAA